MSGQVLTNQVSSAGCGSLSLDSSDSLDLLEVYVLGKICGIEISGDTATIVLLQGYRTSFEIVKSDFKKISISNEAEQSVIKSFHETMDNFIRQNEVDKLCIKKVSSGGMYSASPTAIKIEAILQLSPIPVELLHPTKIASIIKKSAIDEDLYKHLYKYQHKALEVAFCGLGDSV